jgi:2'-hydroxyisoflavone reductase
MRLLVLGGTKFLGRAAVEAALARGHAVTLFNRGQTNPGLFPEAEHLAGDRDGGLDAMRGREWDAVIDPSGYVPRVVHDSAELLRDSVGHIDPSGYVPRVVHDSAELLRDSVGHYVFVSSISVYDFPLPPWYGESAPRGRLAEQTEEVTGESYGPLKALCEDAVRDVFAGAFANVRAGLIVGPHDPTGRFTYWPVRLARGGAVLAPGDPGRRVQLVDVRDLGEWLVRLAEERVVGDFNATGPAPPLTMGELLATCRTATGSDAELVWVPDDFLLERGAGMWMELPLWLAADEASILQADVSRAVAAGLAFRPLAETVVDTLAWASVDGPPALTTVGHTGEAGMTAKREAALLGAWGER